MSQVNRINDVTVKWVSQTDNFHYNVLNIVCISLCNSKIDPYLLKHDLLTLKKKCILICFVYSIGYYSQSGQYNGVWSVGVVSRRACWLPRRAPRGSIVNPNWLVHLICCTMIWLVLLDRSLYYIYIRYRVILCEVSHPWK